MTAGEYAEALAALSDVEFVNLQDELGGGYHPKADRVKEFVRDPTLERRLCQTLGLKTEAEKLADVRAASAELNAAWVSVARIALIVSLIALIIAVVVL